MPHDRNGKLIKVGDIVKGIGFNVPHEVMGPVLLVNESSSCNLTVGIVRRIVHRPHYGMAHVYGEEMFDLATEYGNCNEFEIVKTVDGRE